MKISAVTGLDERSAGMAFEALREKKPVVPESLESGAEAAQAAESGTTTAPKEHSEPAASEKSETPPATENPAKRKRTS